MAPSLVRQSLKHCNCSTLVAFNILPVPLCNGNKIFLFITISATRTIKNYLPVIFKSFKKILRSKVFFVFFLSGNLLKICAPILIIRSGILKEIQPYRGSLEQVSRIWDPDPQHCKQTVLWIRNYFFRIRIHNTETNKTFFPKWIINITVYCIHWPRGRQKVINTNWSLINTTCPDTWKNWKDLVNKLIVQKQFFQLTKMLE
jgi:hypothetical protein